MNPRLTRLPGAWLAAALALSMSATALAAEPRPSFTPPSAASLPDTEFGKIVRQGEQIFLHTPQAAGKFVGNDLNCSSCHLDAGRRGLGAHVGRLCAVSRIPSQERSRQYAGRAPAGLFPLQHERQAARRRRSRADRVADLYVLAGQQGADRRDAGRPGLPQATRAGAEGRLPAWRKVYAQYCAVCHGAEGQGQKNGKHWVFPPYGGGLVQLGRGHAPDRQRGRFHQGQHAAGTGRHAERPGSVGRGLFHERPRTAAGPALRRVGGRDPRQVPRLRRLALRHRGQRPSAGQRFPAPGGKLLQAAKP